VRTLCVANRKKQLGASFFNFQFSIFNFSVSGRANPSALDTRARAHQAHSQRSIRANLYYSQPLLAKIAAELHVTSAAASMISTATQLGYAAGLLLIVPLGDAFERRRLLARSTERKSSARSASSV
jgi:hypothetical protein